MVGGSKVNYQLLSRSLRLKPRDIIWMDSVEPKEQRLNVQDGRMLIRGRMGFWENLRIGHWVVGGSEVNYQLLFRSTRLKPRLHIWMDSVEPKEQRPNVQDGRT